MKKFELKIFRSLVKYYNFNLGLFFIQGNLENSKKVLQLSYNWTWKSYEFY
jgi:hypothetical protein